MNYFRKEKPVDRVYGMVDRVHGASSRCLLVIKRWLSTVGWEAQIKPGKGVFHVQISSIDRATDGSRQLQPVTVATRCTEWWRHGLLLQQGGLMATASFSEWGRHLRGRRKVGTHLGWFLGGGTDRRVVRDGGRLALIYSGSGACSTVLWVDQDYM
jgi:hypothetical protein